MNCAETDPNRVFSNKDSDEKMISIRQQVVLLIALKDEFVPGLLSLVLSHLPLPRSLQCVRA